MIKILLFVFIIGIGIVGNVLVSNAQNTTEINAPFQIDPPSGDRKEIQIQNFSAGYIDYQSDSMVVLYANIDILERDQPIGQSLFSPLWNAIDVIKNQGYSIGQIMNIKTNFDEIYVIFEK